MFSEVQSITKPILDYLKDKKVDAQLQYDLSKAFPISSQYVQTLKRWCLESIGTGNIRMRGPQSLRFGNLLKGTIRIDIVDMTGIGPGHTHPNGEINWIFSYK